MTYTTVNVNDVPRKQWKAWTAFARATFNEVFERLDADDNWGHPKAPKLKRSHWRTLAWNAAWTAAEAVDVK